MCVTFITKYLTIDKLKVILIKTDSVMNGEMKKFMATFLIFMDVSKTFFVRYGCLICVMNVFKTS